ncbi:MAG TPA: DUF4097 family beta strand repeat-containing protein [Vicinamibacterales bacterium]|jgi:hypothetical protein
MRAARGLTGSVVIGLLGLAAAGCGLVPFAPVEGSFDRTLTVSGPVDLDIRSGAGGVQIHAGPMGAVHVVARLRGYPGASADTTARVRRIEANPPVEQNGNAIRIGQVVDNDLYHDVAIEYEVTVPAATSVRSVVGSGGQTIRGPLQGRVDATAGSGGIRVEDTTGEVQVTTGSGGVRLAGIRGALRARAGSGGIRIEGQPTAPWSVYTGSGGIRMSVTGGAPFEVDASTGSGGISSDQEVSVIGARSRHHLHGTVLGGGPLVQLETGSGSIRIE